MAILFGRKKKQPTKPDPIMAPDHTDILRNGWRGDLTDDEIIDLQLEYFQALLPDASEVIWTVNNLAAPARAAYAHGLRERIPALMAITRDSAFGRI